jgi:hypothetical protein
VQRRHSARHLRRVQPSPGRSCRAGSAWRDCRPSSPGLPAGQDEEEADRCEGVDEVDDKPAVTTMRSVPTTVRDRGVDPPAESVDGEGEPQGGYGPGGLTPVVEISSTPDRYHPVNLMSTVGSFSGRPVAHVSWAGPEGSGAEGLEEEGDDDRRRRADSRCGAPHDGTKRSGGAAQS